MIVHEGYCPVRHRLFFRDSSGRIAYLTPDKPVTPEVRREIETQFHLENEFWRNAFDMDCEDY